MGQELELPRQTLTEITKNNATQKTTAEVPFSEKIHMGQHKRRTNQFRTNEGYFLPSKRRKQSKPTLRQPSSAHLAPALSVQINPTPGSVMPA